ncbi:2-dehydropantoate 2-reductase [Trinickia caryophylli]|uniref:2-dehydropantoate 2-reductase n=1 Tax=Trinickia caryophylli TaxID=28094 RepID=A0A1X7DNV3_TRICW|nr:2-dehydropantoate 2-reductase [Trinickia caryophylli]PMS10611.1 2-dehydropantoate 2-reductase [Trinickia caryophylli]TRX17213.1 2-dehydropantoate 2-reductase [Trinickia caryophylli]WQE12053.1 2-dehydropantoate 2-reductase [Trinickia caryophylli]SMF18878.1 ketopantoate reductase [Trinickia caryophylli]GLU31825.1 2-dehydropantoate 2-reductase [Trinickia caryophylli]
MSNTSDYSTARTRTAVVGAGAIGGLLAAALAQAGHDVSVLARGETLGAIRAHGIRVESAGEQAPGVAVRASDAATALGMQDVVIIALKAQALPSLAASLQSLIGEHTVVVSATNGLPWWFLDGRDGGRIEAVDPDGGVSRALPASRAIGCVVHLSASTPAPGIVRRASGNRLVVGAARAALGERARELGAALAAGGFDVELTDDIRSQVWAKLWGNMNMNPLSALTGSTLDRLLDDPFTHALALRMMEEAEAIGEHLGVSTGMSAEARMAVTRQLGAVKTSMLQDLEAGRPLEIDPILGVFPELGRKFGVVTPYCDAVLGLLRQRAASFETHGRTHRAS